MSNTMTKFVYALDQGLGQIDIICIIQAQSNNNSRGF